MTMSRREFVAGAAGTAGAVVLGPLAGPTAAATRRRKAPHVTRELLWSWHQQVADGGPRLTGNKAHVNYVEFLARQLERRRFTVWRDHLQFTKWEAESWSLVVNGNRIPVAYYYPYSGVTPAQGVTAPLAYCGQGEAPLYAAARGKIAVIDAPVTPVPYAAAFQELGRYPADSPSPPTLSYTPSVVDILVPPDLKSAAAAGVLGVICLRSGISDGLAADQYSPFATPYQNCPALWALPSTANQIRNLALQGAKATLTLKASLVPKARPTRSTRSSRAATRERRS